MTQCVVKVRCRSPIALAVAAFCFLLLHPAVLFAQHFHFGAAANVIASQIEGDNLSGFHKAGYSVGVLGGYSVNEKNWVVVEMQHALIGSRMKSEDADVRLEADIFTVNVLGGYSFTFGDEWDGSQRFRAIVGARFNAIIDAESTMLDEESLKNFLSTNLTVSYILSPAFFIDLSYMHSLSNILDAEITGIDKLVPYYLSLGLSYYLNR